jgi:hypothetical protein
VANNSNPLRLFWPEIDDSHSALQASRLGVFASILVGVVVCGPTTYRLIDGLYIAKDELTIDYVVGFLFLVFALGIWRMWKTAAILGLCLYLLLWIGIMLQAGIISGYIVLGGVASFFVSGVRGTFAYGRLAALPTPIDLRDA